MLSRMPFSAMDKVPPRRGRGALAQGGGGGGRSGDVLLAGAALRGECLKAQAAQEQRVAHLRGVRLQPLFARAHLLRTRSREGTEDEGEEAGAGERDQAPSDERQE